jgi:hypothetical protein
MPPLLGTDNLGRDLLVRIAYGARISLLVGVVSTLLATVAGVVIGLAAGYFGGVVDLVLARFMDVVLSFPYLLFAIALVSVFHASLAISILMIAFFSWAAIGRVGRGQTPPSARRNTSTRGWRSGRPPPTPGGCPPRGSTHRREEDIAGCVRLSRARQGCWSRRSCGRTRCRSRSRRRTGPAGCRGGGCP